LCAKVLPTPVSATTQLPVPFKRLAYIDWMRGLACVLMIQAHCYDSWLNSEARRTLLYRWSQELSTLRLRYFCFSLASPLRWSLKVCGTKTNLNHRFLELLYC